jgi:spermidine synthase
MAAMGVGALAVKPLLRWPVPAFAAVELSLGLVGAFSVPLLYAAFSWLNLYVPVLLVVATVIGALIGAEIPLLMELVQRVRRQDAAGAVADLSAADYLGALLGGLAFPFLLLPTFGLLRGALLVGAVNVVTAGLLTGWLFGRDLPTRGRVAVVAATVGALVVLAAASAYAAQFEVTARQRLYRHPIVHAERSRYQEIVLTSARAGGWGDRDVRLYLDGDLQFSSLDEHRYHESLVHPAMAGPHRRVLVLGGGDGLALREVLRYPDVEQVTLVDLDPAVVDLARTDPWLSERNGGAFEDDRVEVVAADAFSWARGHEGPPYDVVLVDLPTPTPPRRPSSTPSSCTAWSAGSSPTRGAWRCRPAPRSSRHARTGRSSSRWRPAGLAATPYHVDVPSFGDWGFVSPARGDDRRSPVADDAPVLRFLTPAVLEASGTFPPDRLPDDVEASTLLDPVILRYQREEWVGY